MAKWWPASDVPRTSKPQRSRVVSDRSSNKRQQPPATPPGRDAGNGKGEVRTALPRAGTGWPKGDRPTLEAQALIIRACETNLPLSVACLVLDHLAIFGLALGGVFLWKVLPVVPAVAVYMVIAVLAARFQRALECMVHEGSHGNFVRGCGKGSRLANDIIGNFFAGLPTFVTIRSFWKAHRLHHAHFGNEDDPDLIRYQKLSIEYMDREKAGSFIAGMMLRLLPYVAGWWMALGFSPLTIVAGLAWHVLVWIVPFSHFFGLLGGVLIWIMFWFLPFTVVLPLMRFLAESAKHEYVGNTTVFAATVSNVGFLHRWLLHPHGDGFHVLHHMFPPGPHHRMRVTHEILLDVDRFYREHNRHRTAVFERPRTSAAGAGVLPPS